MGKASLSFLMDEVALLWLRVLVLMLVGVGGDIDRRWGDKSDELKGRRPEILRPEHATINADVLTRWCDKYEAKNLESLLKQMLLSTGRCTFDP